MWVNDKGSLIHVTDESRERFKTTINPTVLKKYKEIAESNDTTVGYLIETVFENIIKDDTIELSKQKSKRIDFRTTCDKGLLKQVREFAKLHKVNLNTVIEEGITYIDLTTVKKKKWAYRIERK